MEITYVLVFVFIFMLKLDEIFRFEVRKLNIEGEEFFFRRIGNENPETEFYKLKKDNTKWDFICSKIFIFGKGRLYEYCFAIDSHPFSTTLSKEKLKAEIIIAMSKWKQRMKRADEIEKGEII